MPHLPQFPHDLLALLDAAPVPVFAFDSAGRHTFVNAAGCKVMRRDRDQIVGRTMTEIGLPPALGARFDTTVREVLASGAPLVQEATLPTPEGPVVMKVRLAPRHDASGAVVGVVGVSADVTAEVAARHALRADEERYRRVVEDQTEVVCRFKADGTFTFVNEVYCRVLGKSAGELLGHGWQPVAHPDDVAGVEARLRAMSAANPVVVIENRVFDAAGRVRWMEFVNRGFYDPAGALVELQAVGRDVTDRRAAEDAKRALEADLRVKEEQQKYERQLLQSQKLESLGVLAGGIAHDFNNLLTGILGYASLAQMRLGPGDPVADDLKRIEAASQRAADLCQQMLAYAGRGQFVVQPVDVNAMTEEMAQLLGTAISRKAVLKYNLAPAVPAVRADATQLRQIVMNLITNASDAIGTKSGVVTLTTGLIEADARYLAEVGAPDDLPAGPYVYLEVSDTGCGMSDEVKARMFDPFFTTKFTGRGLGLAAVQGIVRAHHGAVKVYTQLGKGTTFKVLLPALAEEGAAAPVAPAPPARDGRGRKVLVVDDEEDVRVFARKVLELTGFAVALAPDGQAGADAFAADPGAFAAVLLDLTMPRLNGADAFRAMRHARAEVRVVLMSGFAEQEATAGFEGKGLAGFLRKPFRADHLLDAVFAAVGG
jgi:PAS domain S-box-containing protein